MTAARKAGGRRRAPAARLKLAPPPLPEWEDEEVRQQLDEALIQIRDRLMRQRSKHA